MIKRIIAAAIAFMMLFSLSACSKAKGTGGAGVISPKSKDGKPELTILVSSIDYAQLSGNAWLTKYINKFKQSYGVDIKLEEISTGKVLANQEQDEFNKKLFVKLVAKDGPELIFSNYTYLGSLIENEAVLDLRGKVENIGKIYESLLSERVCYVPLGIDYIGAKVNRAALAEIGAAGADINWTSADYYAARSKWIANNKKLFNAYEYSLIFEQFIDLERLYQAKERKVVLNTPELRQKINELRSYIFGGSYQLMPGYKYENYYNMMYEDQSEERKKDLEVRRSIYSERHFDAGGIDNLFRAKNLQESILDYAIIKDPRYTSERVALGSYGFLVNKNGKNLDLAYEFINGLLSNEIQMAMFQYEEPRHPEYPVNKELESEILKLESQAGLDPRAIQAKAFVLKELKEGKCTTVTTEEMHASNLLNDIKKDLTKLVLADNPYSDEQLQVELKRMEDKFNIYIKE